jgi:hypothetical protein
MRSLQFNLEQTKLQLAATRAILRKDTRAEKVLLAVRDEELRRYEQFGDRIAMTDFDMIQERRDGQLPLTPEQERDRWRACLSASLTR